jgi:hypothetical protein
VDPKSDEDRRQLEMANRLKSNFPREGFAWKYTEVDDFKTLVARHLRQSVRKHIQAM